MLRLQCTGQRQRARAEDVVRELAVGEAARDAARERVAREPAGLVPGETAQHAVVDEHAVELAGQERREVDDAAMLDARPLAMRARQHGEYAALAHSDRTEQLRFLAAHHVRDAGRIARGDAGHDRQQVMRRADDAVRQCGQ